MSRPRPTSPRSPTSGSSAGELPLTLLRTAAGQGGFRVEDRDEFDYCELGAGPGDTACTLAAAYPRARFVGVDFNPAHVTFAREMAHRGGLENVRFLERDFADLEGNSLPQLDFVCAHGVLAWIAPDKQRALIALAARMLKPGGVLYVSYNALPGWASVQPLRRLLTDAAGTTGSPLERARRAVDLARTLRDGGAQYFASNPAAGEMIATMDWVGPGYTVHEYLQEHWRPMYSADLATEMAAAGLRFAGQLPLHRNVPRLTLPAGLAALFEEPRDRIDAEHLKDFATNNFFRADVYVKSAEAPDSAVASELLDGTRFGTLVALDKVRREVRLPHHELRTWGEPFDSLLAALSERPATLRDLRAGAAGTVQQRAPARGVGRSARRGADYADGSSLERDARRRSIQPRGPRAAALGDAPGRPRIARRRHRHRRARVAGGLSASADAGRFRRTVPRGYARSSRVSPCACTWPIGRSRTRRSRPR